MRTRQIGGAGAAWGWSITYKELLHSNIKLCQVQRESELVGIKHKNRARPFIHLTSFIEKLSDQHISNMFSAINKHRQYSYLLFFVFVFFFV